MLILEGGHVFKDPKTKEPLTQRINQADVVPTLQWLENIIDVPLTANTIGTTGKKATSGDLDIAVDETQYSKQDIISSLAAWVSQNVPDAKATDYIQKSGITLHFKTPIKGNSANGYVQTDFMFGNPEFMIWSSQGEPEGKVTGQHRQILINSIASAKGYAWSGFAGLTNRATKEKTVEPVEITRILLGDGHSPDELASFPKILNAIKDNPDYEKLVAMARDTLPKFGLTLPERSNQITEGQEGPRIQHAEDLIFWEGSAGATRALDLLASVATPEGQSATTVKWDGSPAVIFGRDASGQFIFTDKSGWTAKGYDGKAKTPEELKNIFIGIRKTGKGKEVSSDYTQFVDSLSQAFSVAEQAVPQDYKGFFSGDLLYLSTPPIVGGKFHFKPNIVAYDIEPKSELGQRIGKSKVGIVVHREIDFDDNKVPVQNFNIFQGQDLFVVPPIVAQQPVKINTNNIQAMKSKVSSYASSIDDMLDEQKLRSLKLASFSNLLYTYMNSKVDTGLTDLGSDFLSWSGRQTSISDTAKQNISKYVSQHSDGFKNLWEVVTIIMQVKNDIIKQLDSQEAPVKSSIGQVEGGEGYVVANPSGDIKLVDRAGFTAANRSVQRENLNRLNEKLNEFTIALFPGSFKPPHKGHMAVVEQLAHSYENVLVIVSAPVKKVRSDISAEQAVEIFNLYIKDAGLAARARAIASPLATPLGAAYKIIEEENFAPNTKIFIATSSKDAGRFPQNKLDKSAQKNPTHPTANAVEMQAIAGDTGIPISASQMREVIKSGQFSELRKFMPDYVSEATYNSIISILSGEPTEMTLNEIFILINEMSAIANGAVEGYNSNAERRKKFRKKGNPNKMNVEEKQLREIIRNSIRLNNSNKLKEFNKNKLEEQQLRYILRKLILEVGDEQPIHDNTGINVLEDLLKKIIPVIQTDYKIMTTSEIQRKSFRAHILNAIQNSLKPDLYRKETLQEKKKIKIDLDTPDQSKFIDVFDTKGKKAKEEEDAKTPEARLGAGLEKHGLDSTGRNMALQTFRKVDNSIMDAYVILDDEQDKELFYDYLITNLKLYFDKFEEEMVDMPKSEPTSPQYDQEKAKKESEDEPI
jgi:cytidyltransferase-like protein